MKQDQGQPDTTRHRVMRYPLSKEIDVPYRMVDLARRRTEFLWPRCAATPLRDILASAYLQGIHDASDVMERENASA